MSAPDTAARQPAPGRASHVSGTLGSADQPALLGTRCVTIDVMPGTGGPKADNASALPRNLTEFCMPDLRRTLHGRRRLDPRRERRGLTVTPKVIVAG